jgi:hypothetical protein
MHRFDLGGIEILTAFSNGGAGTLISQETVLCPHVQDNDRKKMVQEHRVQKRVVDEKEEKEAAVEPKRYNLRLSKPTKDQSDDMEGSSEDSEVDGDYVRALLDYHSNPKYTTTSPWGPKKKITAPYHRKTFLY